MDEQTPAFTIVGAGLGGALMANYLGRAGHRVDVYDGRPDPRAQGFVGGRSINLALSTRGLTSLADVGLADRVLEDAIPMRGRMMHSARGELSFQPYSKDPNDAINSVSRGGLNITLLNAAEEYRNVRLFFDQKLMDVNLDAPAVRLQDQQSGEERVEQARVVIGADGAGSIVRKVMAERPLFSNSVEFLEHGYKELTIPPTEAGEFAMEPSALHIWPRGGFMMIALPNKDRSFTCTCFWPFKGENSFERVPDRASVQAFFEKEFRDTIPLMPTLLEDFEQNPTSPLGTVRCYPWRHEDKVVLLGDASHAIVPFYGQGMNAAFEDCRALDARIAESTDDLEVAFARYEEDRKINADTIADLALANFIEMRDHTGSPAFLRRKRFEKTLHRLLPGWYKPLYNMVSFSNIPYAEAREIARRQAMQIRFVGRLIQIALVLIIVLVIGMTL